MDLLNVDRGTFQIGDAGSQRNVANKLSEFAIATHLVDVLAQGYANLPADLLGIRQQVIK